MNIVNAYMRLITDGHEDAQAEARRKLEWLLNLSVADANKMQAEAMRLLVRNELAAKELEPHTIETVMDVIDPLMKAYADGLDCRARVLEHAKTGEARRLPDAVVMTLAESFYMSNQAGRTFHETVSDALNLAKERHADTAPSRKTVERRLAELYKSLPRSEFSVPPPVRGRPPIK
ncbi:hypothetical protein [Thioalkalivibrio thiocyanodenitrificans]|uniref:hypothetical protein n=1 Tax=Thioalkalivibrio thiocyanodenitrificans TaxID=243063 RepID=UPI00037B7903|nr:hypothetical protein [Thioalkalivibrio thiocyanodenitrificans]